MTISGAQQLQVAPPARAEVPGESAAALKPTHRGRVDRVKGWRPRVGPCGEGKLQGLSAAQKAGGGCRERRWPSTCVGWLMRPEFLTRMMD